MASHNSTPQSVLDAPVPSFRWLIEHKHPNRATRRQRKTVIQGITINVPRAARRSHQGPRNDVYRGTAK